MNVLSQDLARALEHMSQGGTITFGPVSPSHYPQDPDYGLSIVTLATTIGQHPVVLRRMIRRKDDPGAQIAALLERLALELDRQ